MTWLLCTLLVAHFIGDFVLQNDQMAIRKSEDWGVLFRHVLIVNGCVFVSCMPWGSDAIWIAAINSAVHFATDAVTSRITKYFYARGDRHNFFVTIGADQLIHSLTLVFLAESYAHAQRIGS